MITAFKKILLFKKIEGVDAPTFYATSVGYWILIALAVSECIRYF